jgi:hypothetical protein
MSPFPPAKAAVLAAIKIVITETGTTIESLRMMTLHLLRLYEFVAGAAGLVHSDRKIFSTPGIAGIGLLFRLLVLQA